MYVELLEAISIKSIKEGGKEKERYIVFGLGLENFTGHITPAVLGRVDSHLIIIVIPFSFKSCRLQISMEICCASSRTTQQEARLSLATVLQSAA